MILIADDSTFMRQLLGRILKKMGHEIVEARDGREAVSKYQEYRPDLVTMDITMPVMDGVEALKEIKRLDENAKVIMVTAMGQKYYVVDAIKSGAMDYIVKPFQIEHISETISRALQTPSSEQ